MKRERLAFAGLLVVLALGLAGCPLLVAGAVGGGAAGAAASAHQGQGEEEHSAGAYAGAIAADVLYVPAKVLFAAAGALTSGVTYLVTVGNKEASSAIWSSAVEGTYVITPRHIEGTEPVRFIGP